MLPRTKEQKEVVKLHNRLRPVSRKQIEWGLDNCFTPSAVASSNGVYTCLECGRDWKGKEREEKVICPSCSRKLEVESTKKRVFKSYAYLAVITTFEGWQVVRYIYLIKEQRKGKRAEHGAHEVVQHWLSQEGKLYSFAKLRSMPYNYDYWSLHTALDLRNNNGSYDIYPDAIYPHVRVLPILKRNGFSGKFYNATPLGVLSGLLIVPSFETLAKAGQDSLLSCYLRRRAVRVEPEVWSAVKICIRNGYTISDGEIWADYIHLLRDLGKDTNSPHYVCPTNLEVAHDRARVAVDKRRARELEEKMKADHKKWEAAFRELKGQYLGIVIEDGNMRAEVLGSVRAYLEEGEVMHHCVYTNKYFLEEGSIILSAEVGGVKQETVEVDLKTMRVVQSRGKYNMNTEYHDAIVSFVNENFYKQLQKQKRE